MDRLGILSWYWVCWNPPKILSLKTVLSTTAVIVRAFFHGIQQNISSCNSPIWVQKVKLSCLSRGSTTGGWRCHPEPPPLPLSPFNQVKMKTGSKSSIGGGIRMSGHPSSLLKRKACSSWFHRQEAFSHPGAFSHITSPLVLARRATNYEEVYLILLVV